jgi:putative spermidine/putrescine transport system ATP-binding protein
MPSGYLKVEDVSQRFGSFEALKRVSLNVTEGEFVTLLGPSGSGKTTTLKIIAGFLDADEGRVTLGGRDLTNVPAHNRDIGMVFQNYALFPHMTVAENVAFPLEMRKVPRADIRSKVDSALAMVRLPGLGNRRPRELSGGQQQRVALARALAFHPKLLLMDEPLGALDRKLREAMQFEIVRISRELGITVVYVTHDQEEALAMSHRIAVYHDGRIEQVGTPEEVYHGPASLFVAEFVGESTAFKGQLEERGGSFALRIGELALPVDPSQCRRSGLAAGHEAAIIVRPESMRAARTNGGVPAGAISVPGRMQGSVYLGATRKSVIDLGEGREALVRVPLDGLGIEEIQAGSAVDLSWDVANGIVVPLRARPASSEEIV